MKKLSLIVTGVLLLAGCQPKSDSLMADRDENNLFLNTAPGKKMIVDLDMCTDVDDACAIRLATALDDDSIIDLQAVTLSVTGPNNLEATRGFLLYDGKPDVPIGRSVVDNEPHESPYWDIMAEYDDGKGEVYDAVKLYRKVLAEADSPVDIVTTGYVTNLEYLLKSEPDEYSPLDGTELVRQKCGQLYVVATTYPKGHCNNVHVTHAARKAADYINKNWPLPILFFTNEVGGRMICGRELQAIDKENKDVVTRSLLAFGTLDGRAAWDPFGVWAGALACGDATKLGFRRGNLKIDVATGDNQWTDDEENGRHFTIYPLEKDWNYYNTEMDKWVIKKAKL